MLNLLEHSGSFKNNDVISIRTHDHKDHVKTMLTTQPPRFKKLRRFFFSYVCPKSTQSESSMQAWYLSVDDDEDDDGGDSNDASTKPPMTRKCSKTKNFVLAIF